MADPPQPTPRRWQGVPSAPGVATGRAHVLRRRAVVGGRRRVPAEDRDDEVARFDGALAELDDELEGSAEDLDGEQHGGIARALLNSHRAVLADPQLVGRARALIADEGLGAERALEQTLGELSERFSRLRSAEFRELWRDVEGIGAALLARLHGDSDRLLGLEAGDVLVARAVTVRDVIDLCAAGAAALVLEEGSLTSHIVVLCRSAGLPAVSGVAALRDVLSDETPLRVDGDLGVIEEVSPATLEAARAGGSHLRRTTRHQPTSSTPTLRTASGDVLTLRANLDIDLDAQRARRRGAVGVGLWRTFYLYLGRETLPSEDELADIFASTLADFAPEPVTIRLLDLSGPFADHELPRELRGLGDCRGVRLREQRPEVLHTQLRALLRASEAGRLRLLLPFVSELDELEAIGAEVDALAAALGVAVPPIGTMIEVPAALLQVDRFAARSDFLAVGSNDLAALLLARNRDAPAIGARQGLPRVLDEAMATIASAARRHGIPASLCGEIASQPSMARRLLQTGLSEFSIAPRLIPKMRAAFERELANAGGERTEHRADREV